VVYVCWLTINSSVLVPRNIELLYSLVLRNIPCFSVVVSRLEREASLQITPVAGISGALILGIGATITVG
jgi:hypothetical protein